MKNLDLGKMPTEKEAINSILRCLSIARWMLSYGKKAYRCSTSSWLK
ncbi:hypothetical protein [Haloimpatiens lingqiaonensis]